MTMRPDWKTAPTDMARILVEQAMHQSWRDRFCLFSTGLEVIHRLAPLRLVTKAQRQFGIRVIEGFGNPPIECAEQMVIWGASLVPKYQQAARAWLIAQGGAVFFHHPIDGRRAIAVPADDERVIKFKVGEAAE